MANDDNLQQWDAIARHLDGERQPLTAQQRETADGIRQDLQIVGRRLDVEVPAQALARAQRSMRARALRPSRLRIYAAMGGVAAAAAIVLAITLSHRPATTGKDVAVSNNTTNVEPAQGAPLNDLVKQVSQNPNEMLDLMSSMTLDQDQLAALKVSSEQALTFLDDME